MQPITIKAQPERTSTVDTDRGDYMYGDKQDCFLRPDWDLDKVQAFLSASNEALQAISLPALAGVTWEAVTAVLPGARREIDLMRSYSQYEDVYTQRFTDSLYPMLILTRDPSQYVTDEMPEGRLQYAIFPAEDVDELLNDLTETGNMNSRVALGRVAQVILGTGFTRMCLPSDGSAIIEWQFAELTNGDILAMAGYEWFNK